jgi:predicted Fe-S protein YdhL (DUF1289 family)
MTEHTASSMASLRWNKFTDKQREKHIAKMVKARKKQAKEARKKKELAQG